MQRVYNLMVRKYPELFWALGLFLLTVALRLPFMTRYFYHLDVAQFSLGMLQYDISQHMPHPPGYFFLVQLGKLLYLLTGNANLSFVLLAIFFSGLAVVLIYLMAKDMVDHRTGLFAALLLASNPLFWGMGETGFSYAEGAFIGALTGFISYRAYSGKLGIKQIIVGGLLIGASGGLRPSDVFFVAPLWLFATWYSQRRWRDMLIAFLAFGGGIGSWFVPTMLMGHTGNTSYRYILDVLQTLGILTPWKKYLLMNTGRLAAANLWAMAGSVILLPFVLKREIPRAFFTFWVLPGIIGHAIINYSHAGYCLVYGVSYSAILAIVASRARPWKYLAIVINTLIFFLWPHLSSDNLLNYSINYISPFYQNLRARDATTGEIIGLIRANPNRDIISIRDRREAAEYYEGPAYSVLRWEFQKRNILSIIYMPDRNLTGWYNGTERIARPEMISDSVIVVIERGNQKTLDMVGKEWLFRAGDTYIGIMPWEQAGRKLAGAEAP